MSDRTPSNGKADSGISRRDLLRSAGSATLGVVLAESMPLLARAASPADPGKTGEPETLVKTLYDSLTPRQRETICMPWQHSLRTKVQANWAIVKSTVAEQFTTDQQEMIQGILHGLTTEEWYPKILSQMQNDSGGLGNYHVALFGDPHGSKFEWVITGRHVTLRADGHSNRNAAFGGPIFYGHAIKDTEDAGHPGNIYWRQGQKANAVFAALDGKQRSIALLDRAPDESKIALQGSTGQFPGIAIGELSRDQKALVQSVMRDLLSPYRPSDADDTMRDIA